MNAAEERPEEAKATRSQGAGLAPWLAVAALTAGLTAVSIDQALNRYESLRSGWSWDLAYYNQWYWALTRGDGVLTVRPISAFADEGPSVWKTNYLSPLRYLLVPIHYAAPDPRTLLVVHSVLFWWVVPAAFSLVRSETRSTPIALAATALVPLTPLIWPLAWNDFREIQLALPFVLWGVQGVRGRDFRVTVLGVAGMLACRQELALVVSSFALLKAREPEGPGRAFRWRHALLMAGLAWFLLGFFGHLRYLVAANAPLLYLEQFTGRGAPLSQTIPTASEFVLLGLGGWAAFLLLAPREALLILPWLWSLSNGKWALRYLSTEEWHHVRYASPVVALGLAAGLIGFGRLAVWLTRRPRGRVWFVLVVVLTATASAFALREVKARTDRQPCPIDAAEAAAVWSWIDQVGPDEGVLAVYDVTAPLSTRRVLYSYILEVNKPRGYPALPPEIGWVFYRNADGSTEAFESQGFTVVHRGPYLTVMRRRPGKIPPGGKIFRRRANKFGPSSV